MNPPNQPLFRTESIEHVSAKQYGTVILARTVSHNFLTALFVVIGLAILAFFIAFDTTRKAQCQGILIPSTGVIKITPNQNGVIKEKRVAEGALVKAGDVMFVLSSERSSVDSASAEQAVSTFLKDRRNSFEAELQQSNLQSQQRIDAARRRVQELAQEAAYIADQIALQRRRVVLAEQAQKRYGDLLAARYISAAQFQDRQVEFLDQQQKLADLQRTLAMTRRDLTTAQDDIHDKELQAQRDAGALRRSVSSLQQDLTENEARREILVRAPQNGMVTAITMERGQAVSANTVLASILPAGAALEAEIYAPSRSAGFVKSGMPVLLRYQAYPYQKFGQYPAVVREVANTSLRPDELTLPGAAPGAAAEPLYRIRLTLDKQTVQAYGNVLPLKSGMLVDASIVLEHRRLYEWVIEPLLSISGKI
jgi:membrane fusion protein